MSCVFIMDLQVPSLYVSSVQQMQEQISRYTILEEEREENVDWKWMQMTVIC